MSAGILHGMVALHGQRMVGWRGYQIGTETRRYTYGMGSKWSISAKIEATIPALHGHPMDDWGGYLSIKSPYGLPIR
jgi:hypothetical protein